MKSKKSSGSQLPKVLKTLKPKKAKVSLERSSEYLPEEEYINELRDIYPRLNDFINKMVLEQMSLNDKIDSLRGRIWFFESKLNIEALEYPVRGTVTKK